jgi:hypothetical protein
MVRYNYFYSSFSAGLTTIRFGGDKGGDVMQFKFGFTVMNYLQTNSPDAFELCLSLDAPDSYFNLKTLFDKKNGGV